MNESKIQHISKFFTIIDGEKLRLNIDFSMCLYYGTHYLGDNEIIWCKDDPIPDPSILGVTDYGALFNSQCTIETLNIGHWDVSHVTNMDNMFEGCKKLTNLNIQYWNTESLHSMDFIFEDAPYLSEKLIYKWNKRNVKRLTFLTLKHGMRMFGIK